MHDNWKLARLFPALALAGFGLASAASAGTLNITFTNNQSAGGLYLTPFLTVFHDGTYDAFDAGSAASAGVEAIAEEGNPAIEQAGAAAGRRTEVVAAPGGVAPVLEPGESTTLNITLDPTNERYFSFLSMVIPSNDAFVGNDNPLAYELFDGAGNFTGLGPIALFGGSIWDAGTEVNDGQGAAFSTAGGISTDENGVITLGPDLNYLVGTQTVVGTTVQSVPGANELLATISFSVVPLPAGMPLLLGGLGLMGLVGRRTRQRA